MRRKNREVSQTDEINSIANRCDICRLSMIDENLPYIVPMNFGYEFDGINLLLFFHCASEGRKIEILKRNPNVCFEMDCGHELIEGKKACDYSFAFESIIGNGQVEFVSDYAGKVYALSKIMQKLTGTKEFDFNESDLRNVTIFKIKSSDFTGKRKIK